MRTEEEKLADVDEGDEGNDGHSKEPARPSSRLTVLSRRSRRNSVQMACERCRRRKIKCSGLPGPCSACASLGTVCHDPGKRKDRMQSLLENRIQRLEALAMRNRAMPHIDTAIPFHPRSASHSPAPFIAQPEPRHSLHIQTENLNNFSLVADASQLSSLPPLAWESWPAPTSPACYSDIGPDLAPWATIEQQRAPFEPPLPPNPSLHRRSHTFPTLPNEEDYSWTDQEIPPNSASAFSDIPSIEVTSPDSSRPQTPLIPPNRVPGHLGFSVPYRSSFLGADEERLTEPTPEQPRTPPLFAMNNRNMDEQLDYYGDFLSPVDQPPSMSRRSSFASSHSGSSVSEARGGFTTRLHRSQTLPTTLTAPSSPAADQLAQTINSPRTRNYVQIYFQQVHPWYPILDPGVFKSRQQPPPTMFVTYQTLLVAAIGAVTHHQSRALSSPYVRLATSLHPQIDTWSSLSGVHCAMLLAIYCFHEETMSFTDEIDQSNLQRLQIVESLRPLDNLWLHTCQIAHACLDLGLNLGFLSQRTGSISMADLDTTSGYLSPVEAEMQMMFRNTFRVAYDLDRKVSRLKQRPTAINEGDLDPNFVVELMLASMGD